MAEYIVNVASMEPFSEFVTSERIGLNGDPSYIEECLTINTKYIIEAYKRPERITRCEDCEYYRPDLYKYSPCERCDLPVGPDDFCSFAEPKEAKNE